MTLIKTFVQTTLRRVGMEINSDPDTNRKLDKDHIRKKDAEEKTGHINHRAQSGNRDRIRKIMSRRRRQEMSI